MNLKARFFNSSLKFKFPPTFPMTFPIPRIQPEEEEEEKERDQIIGKPDLQRL
jgi:hypothetical protein